MEKEENVVFEYQGRIAYFVAEDIVGLGSLDALKESDILNDVEDRDSLLDRLWEVCNQHIDAVNEAKERYNKNIEKARINEQQQEDAVESSQDNTEPFPK